MRKVIWATAGLVLAGLSWWVIASLTLSSSIEGWLEDRRAEGWQAEISDMTRGGFPATVRTGLLDLVLADPGTGLAVSMDELTLEARTLWPGDIALTLPPSPLRFATPDGAVELQFSTGRADLNLGRGSALDIRNLSFTAGPLAATNALGDLFTARSTELRMAQTEDPARYDITLALGQFTPGIVPRTALRLPENWPLVFTALQSRATVTFDRPWDRGALETARPQPRHITLHQAEAHWGEVRLQVTGALDVADTGIPTGEVIIRAQNWQDMLDLAEQSGLLPPDLRGMVQNVLTSLATGSGRTRDLDVTLTLARGVIRVGFLPIGPAPRIRLR